MVFLRKIYGEFLIRFPLLIVPQISGWQNDVQVIRYLLRSIRGLPPAHPGPIWAGCRGQKSGPRRLRRRGGIRLQPAEPNR